MKIATGEIEEMPEPRSGAAELGSKGGKARAAAVSKRPFALVGVQPVVVELPIGSIG